MARYMRQIRAIKFYEGVLANNEVAEQGNVACIDQTSGQIVAGQVGEDLLPIGHFDETLTGNGTATVRVELFREVWLTRLVNSGSPNNVEASDIGNVCYLAGPATVTMDPTGASVAGRVWYVDTDGVHVQSVLDMGPEGPQGPAGPSGD